MGLSQGAPATQPLQPPLGHARDVWRSLPLLHPSWVPTDQDGICHCICHRVFVVVSYGVLPFICWELLFYGVLHGLWNMSFGETHALMILAANVTICYWTLQSMCEKLCKVLCPTCWARVRDVWAWMMVPIILLSALFEVICVSIFYLFPRTCWETYCVKNEIEAVEGEQRGPVAVTDAV